MSKIKSKWTKPERKFHNYLKGYKISHKMHPNLQGRPDLIINDKLIVFIHGCFWHKCPRHYKPPSSNNSYWIPKIEKNAYLYRKAKKILKKAGYNVMLLWEHQINQIKILKKILRKIQNAN